MDRIEQSVRFALLNSALTLFFNLINMPIGSGVFLLLSV